MNCQKDDLAIIVHSLANNLGKTVKCLQFVGPITYECHKTGLKITLESWVIDRFLTGTDGRTSYYCPDAWLRPLRNNDGEDATFQWAGKPNTENCFVKSI